MFQKLAISCQWFGLFAIKKQIIVLFGAVFSKSNLETRRCNTRDGAKEGILIAVKIDNNIKFFIGETGNQIFSW